MRARLVIVVFVIALPLGGCFRHRFAVSGTLPEPQAIASRWHHHFLFGVVDGSTDVELRELCPHGISRIETAQKPLNVLVMIATVFIYAPTTVDVYCRREDRSAPPPVVPEERLARPPEEPEPAVEEPAVQHPPAPEEEDPVEPQEDLRDADRPAPP